MHRNNLIIVIILPQCLKPCQHSPCYTFYYLLKDIFLMHRNNSIIVIILDFSQVVKLIKDEIPSLPWLKSSLEHCDMNLIASGLKVVLALSASFAGAKLLDAAFDRIPGGIWTLMLRYVIMSRAVLHIFYCIHTYA